MLRDMAKSNKLTPSDILSCLSQELSNNKTFLHQLIKYIGRLSSVRATRSRQNSTRNKSEDYLLGVLYRRMSSYCAKGCYITALVHGVFCKINDNLASLDEFRHLI
jgi:hypothetical protein